MNSTLTVDTIEQQVQGMTWHASRTLYGPDERRGARSRCARSACPVHPSFTLTTTWHLRSRSSALLLLCPPARLRERRSVPERAPNTALLLLAPEDNLWNDLALPQRKKPPFCTSPPRSSVRVRSPRRPLRHPPLRHRGCLNPRHRWRCRLRLREAIPRHLPRHLRHPHHQSNPRSCTPRSHNR
jgi:hypothetical protein